MIEHEAQQIILPELDPLERLLWACRPTRGIIFRRADSLMIPFSLMWAGFVVFWEIAAYRESGPSFFSLWGVPFVLVGAYLVVGRFLWDAWRRAHTFYAVTDRRVLIVTRGVSQNVTTLAIRNLPAITLAERRDGIGDIVLGAGDAGYVAAGGLVARGAVVPPILESVPDARQVYNVIRQAQQHAV